MVSIFLYYETRSVADPVGSELFLALEWGYGSISFIWSAPEPAAQNKSKNSIILSLFMYFFRKSVKKIL